MQRTSLSVRGSREHPGSKIAAVRIVGICRSQADSSHKIPQLHSPSPEFRPCFMTMPRIAAEFPAGVRPVLAVTRCVATRDWAVDLSAPGKNAAGSPADLQNFLRPTRYLPTDGIVKDTAAGIIRGARTDLEKARAITSGLWRTPTAIRRLAAAGSGISGSCWNPAIWVVNARISMRSTSVSRVRPGFPRATYRHPRGEIRAGLQGSISRTT